ncbi:MAG: 16S rRNA processing protein RimM, partial [Alphaproteobacteria bacterium]|nr:16S rRNA processing protein RimM [Alphaproteobacteria bacterium]
MTSDKVLIGKIVNAHGIKGDVKIKSFTMVPSNLCTYTPLLKADGSELKIKLKSPANSDVIIAHIDGIDDRTSAEFLKGTEIFTLKS